MIKKLLPLFIFLLLIGNVSALTNLPDDNDTQHFKSPTKFYNIDNSYVLNSTDVFYSTAYYLTLNKYPDTVKISYVDTQNNTLKIYDSISIRYKNYFEFRFFDEITVTTTGTYNNNPISFAKKGDTDYYSSIISKQTPILNLNYIMVLHDFNYINNNNKLNIYIEKNYETSLIKNFYPYKFNINNSNILNSFSSISGTYWDLSGFKSTLILCQQNLNIIFKLVYTVLSLAIDIVKTLTLGLVINDSLANDIKETTCLPMSWLSILIGYLIFILTFIFTMGIVWFTLIIACLLFMFAYIKADKNIYDTFSLFAQYFKGFIENVYIKPLLWFYEKVLLQIIAKIRGSG